MIILRRFLLRFLCRQPVIPLFLLVAGVLYMSSTWSYSGCLFRENISRQPMKETGEVKAMDKMDKLEESVLVNTTQKRSR
ncbi:unnamed protein product [Porites lobata]|uniref:Uncharacterized protein n=1 Tax=Porites lobata TaxID=104759 RepID=A0ABN8P0V8_9CNID|nr:unnamed protein product [Porites lobata]